MMNYDITLTAQICALRHPSNTAALYSCEAVQALEKEVRKSREGTKLDSAEATQVSER